MKIDLIFRPKVQDFIEFLILIFLSPYIWRLQSHLHKIQIIEHFPTTW
jgi:hypothetical protein